jgi:hypothetical protein
MLKKAMDHGSKNKEHAVATIVGKIMPALYPDYIFSEEGPYMIDNSNDKKIVVVSPDGSLRHPERRDVISVEIKCSCPAYAGAP